MTLFSFKFSKSVLDFTLESHGEWCEGVAWRVIRWHEYFGGLGIPCTFVPHTQLIKHWQNTSPLSSLLSYLCRAVSIFALWLQCGGSNQPSCWWLYINTFLVNHKFYKIYSKFESFLITKFLIIEQISAQENKNLLGW